MLYSFPVSILRWDSPGDYTSLSHPGPLPLVRKAQTRLV